VEIDGSDLEVSPLATTRMACADPAISDQETSFLLTLDEATGYTIDSEGRLVVTGSDTQLVFEVAEESG
jgi:heat shock protein HslJ